ERFAYDHAFRPAHAGLGAKLRVPAFDKLPEQRCIKTRADGIWCRVELARMTIKRRSFTIVIVRHIDDERGGNAVIDEVITNPLDFPGFSFSRIPSEPAIEDGFGDERARYS